MPLCFLGGQKKTSELVDDFVSWFARRSSSVKEDKSLCSREVVCSGSWVEAESGKLVQQSGMRRKFRRERTGPSLCFLSPLSVQEWGADVMGLF
jgi:hypothetical protein